MKISWSDRKPLLASLTTLLALLIISYFVYTIINDKILTVVHQETGQIYLEMPIKAGDLVEYGWIHSFEHIPWHEYYTVQSDNQLMLYEIQVAGFGAGIPENKGTVTVENGMVIMRDISETYKYINWINSNTALEYISINNKIVITGKDLPHHEPVQLIISRRFIR